MVLEHFNCYCNFTPLWANAADNKMLIFFFFFPENRFGHFMQIVSTPLEMIKANILTKIHDHHENMPI